MTFLKHDEGVRKHDVDCEVWIMLMLFPNDARNNNAIAKAIVGFGLLRYWYDSTNNARVVCKVHLNDDAKIPDDVVVTACISPAMRSWTCPEVILKRKGVTVLGDEDMFPPADGGVAHPLPSPPPRWMGMDGPNVDGDYFVGNVVSHSAHGPSSDVNMSEPTVVQESNVQVDDSLAESSEIYSPPYSTWLSACC